MGILERVLQKLTEAGFPAELAYSGKKHAAVTEPVAAVHIGKVDRGAYQITVEVSVLCPAGMGGTACEVEALRATEILRWTGAVCVQNGCSYDGVAQVYVVPVLATFTGVTEADSCEIGPGFEVYINEVYQPFVKGFWEEESTGYTAEYEMGEAWPAGISREKGQWVFQLEELIPAGSPETAEPAANFELKLVTNVKTEKYFYCRWTSIRREFTREGLKRIRKGFCMDRVEV